MKIALVNLPWYKLGKIGVRAGSRWPHLRGKHESGYLPFPFFLAYAAALLKQDDFEVVLVDAIAESLSYRTFIKKIRALDPDLLVCETSTVTLKHDIKLLKEINRDIPIVLCGPDANIRKPSFIQEQPFIAYILNGEYECTLLDLAQHIRSGASVKDLPGLIYLDAGKTVINQPRPLADLNKLPWPLRDGLSMQRYNDAPGNMPLPSVQMIASRGCPYRCSFCLWPQVMYHGNSYRVREIIDVVKEMEYLVKEMGFKSVYFDDDTFNCGKGRMLEFCDEIRKRGLNSVPWAIMARPDLMDEEILRNMKDAGLYAIKYGIESANQSLLDNINKNMDLKKSEEMVRFTQALGIKTHLTFTFGLPGETKKSIARTIHFAVNLDPDSVQFSITTPFPGTTFYREMENKGYILSREWSEYDGNYKSVICSEHLTKRDLETAIRSAYREWAEHCIRRRYLLGQRCNLSRSRLFLYYVKKYGIRVATFKSVRFAWRISSILFWEKLKRLKNSFKVKPKGISRLTVGRLALVFGSEGVKLFWDDRELTRESGFVSSINFNASGCESADGGFELKEYKEISPSKVQIKKSYREDGTEELWTFEVIDEKQIDWTVEATGVVKEKSSLARSIGVILSEEYLNWVDSWGEGGFYPSLDKMEVELRNAKTKIIGVRGRKKTMGEIPTILLDASGCNGIEICARNSASLFGTRVLEIRRPPQVFIGRVKIVEEDFTKRKNAL